MSGTVRNTGRVNYERAEQNTGTVYTGRDYVCGFLTKYCVMVMSVIHSVIYINTHRGNLNVILNEISEAACIIFCLILIVLDYMIHQIT